MRIARSNSRSRKLYTRCFSRAATNARNLAFGKRNLKLIGGDELVELMYKYYDQLDGKYKGPILLRRVFIPETLSES